MDIFSENYLDYRYPRDVPDINNWWLDDGLQHSTFARLCPRGAFSHVVACTWQRSALRGTTDTLLDANAGYRFLLLQLPQWTGLQLQTRRAILERQQDPPPGPQALTFRLVGGLSQLGPGRAGPGRAGPAVASFSAAGSQRWALVYNNFILPNQPHLDSWYPTISYVDIRYRRLTYESYDIVVQTYDIIHHIVCTFPIEYPMYTIFYVDTTISHVQHTI